MEQNRDRIESSAYTDSTGSVNDRLHLSTAYTGEDAEIWDSIGNDQKVFVRGFTGAYVANNWDYTVVAKVGDADSTTKYLQLSPALDQSIASGDAVSGISVYCRVREDEMGEDPDPNRHFIQDVYFINRKKIHNKLAVELELASGIDYEGSYIPGRQVVKNTCTHTYRFWDKEKNNGNGDFEQYDGGNNSISCPYTGANYYNLGGDRITSQITVGGVVRTIQEQDICGKRLSDCKKRFGNNGVLPFRGFPGVAEA